MVRTVIRTVAAYTVVYCVSGALLTVCIAWFLAAIPSLRKAFGEQDMVHSRTAVDGRRIAVGSVESWFHRDIVWDFNDADSERWRPQPAWVAEPSIRKLMEKSLSLAVSSGLQSPEGFVREFGVPFPCLGYATYRVWTVGLNGPKSELYFVDGLRAPVWLLGTNHALPLRPREGYFVLAVLINSVVLYGVVTAVRLLHHRFFRSRRLADVATAS